MAEKVLNTVGVNNVPYVSEPSSHPEYGGAAVIQMTLTCDKVNASGLPSLDLLFSEASGRNTETSFWHIDPDGMEKTLNARDPRGPMYVQYIDNDVDSANGKLVYTIDHYEVPPALPAYGGPQWISIVGYRTDESQSPPVPEWFKVHDPSFATGLPAFYTYTAAYFSANINKKITGGSKWLNKYVSVSDPTPDIIQLRPALRRIKRPGDRLLKPEEATELAVEGLREHELFHSSEFERALHETKPARPVLVKTLGERDSFYYLLSFGEGKEWGPASMVVAVDALYGDLLSAAASHESFYPLRLSPKQARDRVFQERLPSLEDLELLQQRLIDHILNLERNYSTVENTGAHIRNLQQMLTSELSLYRQRPSRIQWRPETVEVSKTMVWSPVADGVSMFNPYYVVFTGEERAFVNAFSGEVLLEAFWRYWLRLGG